MPRVKAAPTRRVDDGGCEESAADGMAPTAAVQPKPITLRVRHAGGMSRVEVDAARCTVATLKTSIAELDSVLADPDKMLLYDAPMNASPFACG